jgi:hypothetical protein
MSIASLSSHVRPIGVLLGGSGVCQSVPRAKAKVGALLSPGKPHTSQDALGSVSVASVNSLREIGRHD